MSDMKHKRLQGAVFLIIGIGLLLVLSYMFGVGVVPDLTVWVLAGVVEVCGIINIAIGSVLMRK